MIVDATVAEWDETLAVNLRAPFLLAQAVAPKMIEQGSGKVINVSSAASVIGLDEHVGLLCIQGGLNMLTKAMAVEWGRYNIQVQRRGASRSSSRPWASRSGVSRVRATQ